MLTTYRARSRQNWRNRLDAVTEAAIDPCELLILIARVLRRDGVGMTTASAMIVGKGRLRRGARQCKSRDTAALIGLAELLELSWRRTTQEPSGAMSLDEAVVG